MADIILGQINLTQEQLTRSESLKTSVIRGFKTKEGVVTVTVIGSLTGTKKQSLITNLNALSKDPLPKTRLDELKSKPVLTIPEITEALKIQGIL